MSGGWSRGTTRAGAWDQGRQQVLGQGLLAGSGLRWVPVDHQGNVNDSDEEADAIVAHLPAAAADPSGWTPRGRRRTSTGPRSSSSRRTTRRWRSSRHRLERPDRVGTVDKIPGSRGGGVHLLAHDLVRRPGAAWHGLPLLALIASTWPRPGHVRSPSWSAARPCWMSWPTPRPRCASPTRSAAWSRWRTVTEASDPATVSPSRGRHYAGQGQGRLSSLSNHHAEMLEVVVEAFEPPAAHTRAQRQLRHVI